MTDTPTPPEDAAPDRSKATDPPKKPPAKKAAAAKKKAGKRGPGRPKSAATLGKEMGAALGDYCALAYLGAAASGQDRVAYDLNVLVVNAEAIGVAIGKACEASPAVYRAVSLILTGSSWGEVFGTLLAVAVPIAVNHGLIPLAAWDRLPGTGLVEPPTDPPQRLPFGHRDPEDEARAQAAFDDLRGHARDN